MEWTWAGETSVGDGWNRRSSCGCLAVMAWWLGGLVARAVVGYALALGRRVRLVARGAWLRLGLGLGFGGWALVGAEAAWAGSFPAAG